MYPSGQGASFGNWKSGFRLPPSRLMTHYSNRQRGYAQNVDVKSSNLLCVIKDTFSNSIICFGSQQSRLESCPLHHLMGRQCKVSTLFINVSCFCPANPNWQGSSLENYEQSLIAAFLFESEAGRFNLTFRRESNFLDSWQIKILK